MVLTLAPRKPHSQNGIDPLKTYSCRRPGLVPYHMALRLPQDVGMLRSAQPALRYTYSAIMLKMQKTVHTASRFTSVTSRSATGVAINIKCRTWHAHIPPLYD